MAGNATLPDSLNKASAGNASPHDKAPKRVTKKERLEALLRRKSGASLEALQKEFDWQSHTVRAAISGVRRAGYTVVCVAGKSGSVYRLVGAKAGQ